MMGMKGIVRTEMKNLKDKLMMRLKEKMIKSKLWHIRMKLKYELVKR